MKIRNGFVSNSSSSSFVVAFPHKPTSKEDVQKMLFGDKKEYHCPFNFNHENLFWSTSEVADTVWNDIQSQNPNDKNRIVDALDGSNDEFPHYPSYEENISENIRLEKWDKWEKECEKIQNRQCEDFMKENKNTFIYTFEYSDNSGDYYCSLEHGNLFENLNYIRVGRH